MKIALMMENSQAAKNPIILNELKAVADEKGYAVYNVGMNGEDDHQLTDTVSIRRMRSCSRKSTTATH